MGSREVSPFPLLIASFHRTQQRRLVCQLEKDDLIYDVFESITPYELTLRVKSYERNTLKMIGISDIREAEIKKELLKDKMSYLLESHRREELAKYLV